MLLVQNSNHPRRKTPAVPNPLIISRIDASFQTKELESTNGAVGQN